MNAHQTEIVTLVRRAADEIGVAVEGLDRRRARTPLAELKRIQAQLRQYADEIDRVPPPETKVVLAAPLGEDNPVARVAYHRWLLHHRDDK